LRLLAISPDPRRLHPQKRARQRSSLVLPGLRCIDAYPRARSLPLPHFCPALRAPACTMGTARHTGLSIVQVLAKKRDDDPVSSVHACTQILVPPCALCAARMYKDTGSRAECAPGPGSPGSSACARPAGTRRFQLHVREHRCKKYGRAARPSPPCLSPRRQTRANNACLLPARPGDAIRLFNSERLSAPACKRRVCAQYSTFRMCAQSIATQVARNTADGSLPCRAFARWLGLARAFFFQI
jgi:hypothetical protein